MRLYLDIETLPTDREDVRDRIHDAALQDAMEQPVPAKIQSIKGADLRVQRETEWRGERIEAAVDAGEEAYRKTALDGGYGCIACVCWAWDGGPILDATAHSGDETAVLRSFFGDVLAEATGSGGYRSAIVWCGHNVQFDLRFLHHRAIVLGVKPPVPIPANDPPWKGTYIDTMTEWAGLRDRVKLKTLCDILGIDISADDIDGSEVWDAWQEGRVDDVVEHCRADVARVREIVRRLRWEEWAALAEAAREFSEGMTAPPLSERPARWEE